MVGAAMLRRRCSWSHHRQQCCTFLWEKCLTVLTKTPGGTHQDGQKATSVRRSLLTKTSPKPKGVVTTRQNDLTPSSWSGLLEMTRSAAGVEAARGSPAPPSGQTAQKAPKQTRHKIGTMIMKPERQDSSV